jgi:APA family basic amino acid/polyamine antiporter
VLIAFEGATFSETAMATAIKLASHRRGDLRVVVTIEVPTNLDIGAPLLDAETKAQSVIEVARQWVHRGQRVQGTILKVRPGEAGHRIVREAEQARVQAIVMAMPQHRPARGLLNETLAVVLRKRPCRVIIDSVPAQPIA